MQLPMQCNWSPINGIINTHNGNVSGKNAKLQVISELTLDF